MAGEILAWCKSLNKGVVRGNGLRLVGLCMKNVLANKLTNFGN